MEAKNKCKTITKKGKTKVIIKSIKGQNLNMREVEDLQNQKLDYALPLEIITKGKNFVLIYDITDDIPLARYMHTKVSREKFAEMMLQMLGILQKATQSLYNLQNLILDPEKIMVNPSSGKIRVMFVPILYYEYGTSVRKFLLNLIGNTTFENAQECDYVEKCIAIINRGINFSIVELQEYLESLQKSQRRVQREIFDGEPEKIYDPKKEPVRDIPKEEEDDFNPDTTNLESVAAQEQKGAYIVRKKTGQKYYLKGTTTTIGKQNCDITVSDNRLISRHHAEIVRTESGYSIKDSRSTNGTSVGGRKLKEGDTVNLKNNMELKLADEIFQFVENNE